MSQALKSVNVTGADTGRGDHPYPPQSALTQELRGTPNFVDGSGPIFSMYLEMATEDDKKMVEGWKADADGILIFTGLFSAAVASLISVTIQDIRPNPQDTSNFYLANIYQTLADPNRSTSSSFPASPPPFTPPNYSVWVNTLLFLSLVISISCALLATLLQQWARSYLKITQPRYSPHKRARIRAFFFEGVDKFLLPWAVEALPTLLHVSLFLFFSGISVFLWNVNLTIFKSVLSWIGVCFALYGCITFVPIFRHDSPYHTPLSLPARHIITGISYLIFRALRRLTLLDYFSGVSYYLFVSLEESYRKQLVQGMQKTAEETALKAPSAIDTRALMWTFDSLDEDHELERFFSGLPGFRSSKVVDDPLPGLTEEQRKMLSTSLMGLFDRTFSSNLLPEPVKDRRAIICAKALDLAHNPRVFVILNGILSRCQYSGPMSAEIVQIMSGWGEKGANNTNFVAVVCKTIARVQRHDDSWFILASNELGVQEYVLREYATHGDSLSLAILIHITRQQFRHFWEGPWPRDEFSELLEATSKFNVRDTSLELQYDFCALWDQIVLKAQNDDDEDIAWFLLRRIRGVWISLHQDTDSALTRFYTSTDNLDYILREPTAYPVCNAAAHTHNDSTPTAFPRADLDDNAAPVPASPDTPSSVPAPLHIVESLTDVPPLDNFHSAHQTTTESHRIPAVTSPDPATADPFLTSGKAMPHPSTPAPFLSTTSSPAAVSLQHNPELLTPPDPSNLPSLASSNPVLDNTPPTESHRSLTVTPSPSNPPRPTSASGLDATTEDDGSPKPSSRKEKDTLDPPLVNRAIHANIMASYLLSQSPSLPLVTDSDVAIAGRSLWEHTEDHSPRHSHYPFDIV